MRTVCAGLGAGLVLSLVGACGGSDEDEIQNPPRDEYSTWVKIEPPGVVRGNNSQYKFFANFSAKSDNLVVVFEPGGACWDYDSCTGKNGIRGAANRDGLPDDHWVLALFISPFLSRSTRRALARLEHGLRPVLHRRRAHRQPRRHVHAHGQP